MAVSRECFLQSAKEAMVTGTEIGYRNCVSRSYYSMYHAVLAILKNEVPFDNGGGVHFKLIKYLENAGKSEPHCAKKLKKLAYFLKISKDQRCKADYEIDRNHIAKSSAEDAISRASRVMAMCDELAAAA
ncbi:HEPN domain-containing protein [Shewanella sp. SM55]|uniref:HEPN domain-containing protein n=1 Tax=Shewanella sp. SM55 TaxID=2912800 RepID=UPI0021DB3E02|nr:HEPN domain-containing protein [Shewanella sp. SM55]MCU8062503.1 HEPN domain-containing protein [Shewanella sp. SM55]